MRYMTQEWYNGFQPSPALSALRASKHAEIFLERYFQALYRRKLRAHLKKVKEYSEYSFEDEYPDYAGPFDGRLEDYESAEEFERARNEYASDREELRAKWEPTIYDEARERVEFEEAYRERMDYLREELPEDILKQVADIRVLALQVAAPEVKAQIQRFVNAAERKCIRPAKAYWKGFEKLLKKYPDSFLQRFYFHDSAISGIQKRGKNLVVSLNNERWNTCENEITRITFVNCEILRRDKDLTGSDWLYEEIYEIKGGWEIHVMAFHEEHTKANPLNELIVRAEDVRLE